jgi:hypothetical protein
MCMPNGNWAGKNPVCKRELKVSVEGLAAD